MSRVEVYKARSKKADRMDFYWRFRKNGNIMADGGGYTRRIDCLTGCATVLGGVLITGFVVRRTDGFDWEDIPVVDLTRKARP